MNMSLDFTQVIVNEVVHKSFNDRGVNKRKSGTLFQGLRFLILRRLDITHLLRSFFAAHFPGLWRR